MVKIKNKNTKNNQKSGGGILLYKRIADSTAQLTITAQRNNLVGILLDLKKIKIKNSADE